MRLEVGSGDNVFIAGFIITGNAPKQVLIRCLGPSLTEAGLSGVLQDPTLELHGSVSLSNDNWKETQQSQIVATGIPPSNAAESAIVATLAPGQYTAILAGKNGTTGIGLVEVYDLNPAAASKLANVSTRGFVATGNQVMIGGFIIGGRSTDTTKVIVRAIGPTLPVCNRLADPTLELHDSNGALVRANDNWQDDPTQAAQVQAIGLALDNPLESALAATLPPGTYTAVVAGKAAGTGAALIEVYNVP